LHGKPVRVITVMEIQFRADLSRKPLDRRHELAGSLRFPAETCKRLSVVCQLARQKFEGDKNDATLL